MKRFLYRLSVFVCLTCTLLCVLELLARHAPNPYKAKDAWMRQHADSVQVLFVGSSHLYYGLHGAYFTLPAYSLANVAQTSYYDYALLKRYIGDCRQLRYVVGDMSDFTPLSDVMEDGPEWYRVISYELYMGMHDHSACSRYRYELAYMRVFQERAMSGLRRLLGQPGETYPYGFATDCSIGRRHRDWNVPAKALQRHIHPYQEEAYQRSLAHYRAMAQLCKEHHVPLIFLSTPMMPVYARQVPPATLALMQRLVQEVREVYPDGVHYLNLYADMRFTDEDFYDTDHLNPENGAPKLSRIVDAYIMEMERGGK